MHAFSNFMCIDAINMEISLLWKTMYRQAHVLFELFSQN